MRGLDVRSLPTTSEARNRVGPTKKVLDKTDVPPELKEFAEGKRYYVRTFGCQANIRDGEVISGYLEEAGFSKADDPKEADIAVINTCAVRENAEDKVYGEIGSFKANYEKNHDFLLLVCGCMMQEEGKALYVMERYPFVSVIFGTHNIGDMLSLINDSVRDGKRIIDVRSFPGEVVEGLPSRRLSGSEAFVNISYGCDKFCTYCIVPYTRGKERSREESEILKECEELRDLGYKQITLLGQNVNSYGLDLKDGSNFADLLDKVASLGIPRVRFLTSYPSQFTDGMIDVMAKHENVMKWLHLPVQSGSDSCLRRMGRRYTREEYLDLVRRIRAKMPDIALTTDIIVGFPNETEEEFEDTLSLCREVSYSAAFTFIYSPRVGTPAARIKDDVPLSKKHERFNRLTEVIEETTSRHSESMVGRTFDVLVEGPSKRDKEVLSGYAENGKLINFRGPAYLQGAIVPVKVKESHTYSLIGELVGDPVILKARDVAFLLSKDPVLREYRSLKASLEDDPSIKELGERLEASKKALALSIGDKEEHAKRKKEYEAVLKEIRDHPLLHNEKALLSAVEERLLEVREALR